jgi:putative flavoprotein involved in K+ transport
MGHYDMPIADHPSSEKVRQNENHYLTGRDGGREIDLRRFALRGMKLYGMLDGVEGQTIRFRQDLTRHLDAADATYLRIRKTIDDYIEREGIDAPQEAPYVSCWAPETDPETLDLAAEGIGSVIWSTGFRMDFSFVDAPVFDGRGYPPMIAASPCMTGSISSACPGCTPGARDALPVWHAMPRISSSTSQAP